METAGEDPVLVAAFGAALSRGIAGNATTMLAAPAPKHFSCYCGPENWGGIYRWTFDAVVKEKYLTEYFHVGWVSCLIMSTSHIRAGRAWPVVASFHRLWSGLVIAALVSTSLLAVFFVGLKGSEAQRCCFVFHCP